MLPVARRFGVVKPWLTDGTYQQVFLDFEQRRNVLVQLPVDGGTGGYGGVDEVFSPRREAEAFRLARQHFAGTPSEDIAEVDHCTPLYLSMDYIPCDEYRPPHHVQTILRSELMELGHYEGGVDLCFRDIRGSAKKLVFKYYYLPAHAREFWNEITTLLALPADLPNLLPIEHLVLDELTRSGVVGFTTRFLRGGDLGVSFSRPIKLKWLRQLMQVVDKLNLQYGVCHGNIAPRNIWLDPNADEVYLCDFHLAARAGEADPQRNDVKGVVLTLFGILTKDPRCGHGDLSRLDEAELVGAGRSAWVLHPTVRLDGSLTVDQCYDEITEWARSRRTASETDPGPQAIGWRRFPAAKFDAWKLGFRTCREASEQPGAGQTERSRDAGATCASLLNWARPATDKLQAGRRLVATGRYEDDAGPDLTGCIGHCAEEASAR